MCILGNVFRHWQVIVFYLYFFAGHAGEISKVQFNPSGNQIITGSSDCTAKILLINHLFNTISSETGELIQSLDGHTDEIFSCSFNYEGDIIITGKIWVDVKNVNRVER